MSKMFLLIYDGVLPPRAELVKWLDVQPEILNWHASTIHNLLVILWEGSLLDLRDLLKAQAGLNNFVLIEGGASKFNSELTGWLSKATWDFITQAEPKMRPPASPPQRAAM